MPTNLDLKLLKGQELGPLNDASKANLVKEKRSLHPEINDCRRHVKRPQLDGKQLIAILRKKCCTVPVLTKILPNRALKPGIV